MIQLDVRTVLVGHAVSNAICLLVMANLWSRYRQRSPIYGYWLADLGLQFTAVLLMLAPSVMDELPSLLLSTPLVLLGALLFWQGLRRHVGLVGWRPVDLATLAALVVAHTVVTLGLPSAPLRTLVLTLGLLLFSAYSVRLLLGAEPVLRAASRQLRWNLFLWCAVSIAQALWDRTLPSDAHLLSGGSHTSAVLLAYQMLTIGQTLALFLMSNRLLLADLERDLAARRSVEAEVEAHRRRLEEMVAARTEHLEEMVAARTDALQVAKEAAEAGSRAKSIFLSNMSHELRTPMNAIIGMTSLAMMGAAQPKQREQLTKVDASARRLLAVINDILDIANIESDRQSLETVDFRLGDLVVSVEALVGVPAADKHLKLHLVVAPELAQLSVSGDPLRLKQVLMNLTTNAVRFTAAGSVTLRVQQVEEGESGVLLRWEVQDTGIGIAEQDLQRIFYAFEQADNSMTRKHGGTGLGLAICRRLVASMGGAIGVNSQVGQGSTFWFTVCLPRTAPRNVATPQAPFESVPQFAGSRALVVDDELVSRETLRGMLEEAGVTVETADDGAKALAMAQTTHYDVIFMDVLMPRLNGLDATRAIRQDSLNRGAAILAVTAGAIETNRDACLAAGMDDFLAKPPQAKRLWSVLERWSGRAPVVPSDRPSPS